MAATDGPVGGLPDSLREIAEVIGIEAALILARDFGGGELYIPKRLTPGHPIARSIGPASAEALCTYFASGNSGQFIEIPRASGVSTTHRQRQIVTAVAAGMSKRAAARTWGATTRWVRALCNRETPPDPDQPKLF